MEWERWGIFNDALNNNNNEQAYPLVQYTFNAYYFETIFKKSKVSRLSGTFEMKVISPNVTNENILYLEVLKGNSHVVG